nr:hypothetical protein [Tanacetum cinerariifolium]
MPLKHDFSGLEEFVNEPIVSEPTIKKPVVETSEDKPKVDRKNFGSPIIEDWISDSKDEDESKPKIEKKTGKPSFAKIEFVKSKEQGNPQQDLQNKRVIDSRCSRHMTGNMSYLIDYKEIDRGYVAFGGYPKGGKITSRGLENLIDHKVQVIRCDNRTEFKNREMNQFCEMKVNTACYVQNRVLVVKPHNKTPYELLHGRTPDLSFMRPFGCPVTILNTKDHLRKFDGKTDKGFFVGYSLNSKAFRVFNNITRIVGENLHISDDGNKVDEDPRQETEFKDQDNEDNVNKTNNVNVAGINRVNVVDAYTNNELSFNPGMHELEDISTFNFSNEDETDGAEADINNLDIIIQVSLTPTTRIYKDHPLDQVIGDLHSTTQTRHMSKNLEEYGFVTTIHQRTNHKDLQNCLFACFISQEEPKKVIYALKDPSWIEAMQEELLQFKLQEVWTLVDLPYGKKAIGTKGKIDKTLFIRRHKDDILLVQVYVDDIILGLTKKELYNAFEMMMHEKFQMSSMGELTFFLKIASETEAR